MPRKKLVIDEKHVMSLKVVGLRKLCAKYKLAKKGRKAALQDRILEHLQLGKYVVVVQAEPIEASELETAHTTAQSGLEELKVQGGQYQESVNSLSGESKDAAHLKEALELEKAPKAVQKLPSADNMIPTSDGEKGDVIPENVATVGSIVEKKVEAPEGSDTVTEETLDNNENKAAGIKRTSSEATISGDDNTREKKRKIAKRLKPEEPEEASAEVGSREESSESTGAESQVKQKPKDSESNVSSSNKTSSEIEAIGTPSQEYVDDEEASTQSLVHEILQQNENLEKKLVAPLSKAAVTVGKKTEEVSKALNLKDEVEETVSKTMSTASDSLIKIDDTVSKAVKLKKADEILPKDVELKKQIPVSPLLKKKKILPTKKPASSSQMEEKESKSTDDEDDGQLSKSNQEKKRAKRKESNSKRGYQQRDVKKKREQNSSWHQNKGNRNNRDRDRNRNSGYQPSYRQSNPSWLYPQSNWNNSRADPRRTNSMPLPQQQRGWNSQGGWQQQRSYYIGGYGHSGGRSGRDRDWNRRNNGRWQNRRNVWRDNKRGSSGRR